MEWTKHRKQLKLQEAFQNDSNQPSTSYNYDSHFSSFTSKTTTNFFAIFKFSGNSKLCGGGGGGTPQTQKQLTFFMVQINQKMLN
jgi:hypothetical protein